MSSGDSGKVDLRLVADLALTSLHENAKRVERIAMRMLASSERDELLWIVEAMMDARDRGQAGIGAIAKAKR